MKFRLEKKHIPFLILAFFSLLLFFMGIANHYYFRTVTFDYGNYNFAFRDYAHFRISPMPTYPGNFLQDHFSFTLMFLVPLYWLLNWLTGTYTLIIIQNSLIIIAGWYTYRLITLKTDSRWLGAGVLIYYFVILARYTTFSCDVNLAVISSCFIPVFIYYFEKKNYLASSVLLLLSLLSRENIPLWFISIFMVLIIQHRKDSKAVWFSILGIAVSLIYFILLFKYFIPAVESEEKQFTLFNYAALGANPGEALQFVLHHPLETVKLFFVNHLNDPAYDGVKAEFYFVYLASGGILLLLRPQYLIWFIPVVAQKVLNDSYIRWGISTYYSIEVATLLPIAVFLTLASLKSKSLQTILATIACIVTIYITIYKLDPANVKIKWTLNPAKERIYKKEFFQTPFDIRKINQILEQIPGNARVSASDRFFSHLSQRDYVRLFPKVGEADYIIFSVFDNYFMFSHMENEKTRNKYMYSPDWEIIESEFPVFLLKKKGIDHPIGRDFIGITFMTDTLRCNYEMIDTTRQVVFLDDGSYAERFDRISIEASLSGQFSLKLDPRNPWGNGIKVNGSKNPEYIEASVWFLGNNEHPNIVASCDTTFYLLNSNPDTVNSKGWKKLELGFWIPRNINRDNLVVYTWNSGTEPIYFDDFIIIRKYRNRNGQDQ